MSESTISEKQRIYTLSDSFNNYKLQLFQSALVVAGLLLFYVPLQSLWFLMTFSLFIGFGHYILVETYPREFMIFSMVVKYQIHQVKKKFDCNGVFKDILNKILERTPYIKIDGQKRALNYYDTLKVNNKNKKFIFLFFEKYRSNDLIIFKNEDEKDITDEIEPYLGPLQNFHGVPITPGDLNHKKIKVFRDGEICLLKTFDENDPIILQ
jgi:hypothetical protein